MGKQRNRKDRRLIEMAIVLAGGVLLLLFLLKTGTELTVPYAQDSLIDRYAQKNQVDKALVAAVIYQESRYKPDAVSQSGATGLMQLMPDTARWIAGKINQTYSREKLKDPEYNIGMGTYYLAYLSDKYDGDVKLTLAAYNAGPGNVDDWLTNKKYATAGKLTLIPFTETRNYVENVLRMQKVYQKMFSKQTGAP